MLRYQKPGWLKTETNEEKKAASGGGRFPRCDDKKLFELVTRGFRSPGSSRDTRFRRLIAFDTSTRYADAMASRIRFFIGGRRSFLRGA